MRTRYAYDTRDFICIAVIFSLMGGLFWAIRGTGGYGGAAGGALAGLGWALLWHFFSRYDGNGGARPYSSGHIVAAIVFGIAFGGFTGYGVYTAWIGGRFYLDYPEGVRDIAPWTGYAMLFLCGLHWGGIPGALMAWSASDKPVAWHWWPIRIAAGILGAVLAGWIVRQFPGWFLPFYDEGIYQEEANATCIRAEGSIRNIAPHVGLFLGFLAAEMARRDKRAIAVLLIMGLGFALPFSIGGWWHSWHMSEIRMPWWKFWEMSIGLGGGLAIAAAFILHNRPAAADNPNSETGAGWAWPFIALATVTVVLGVFDGVSNHHGLDLPGFMDMIAVVLSLGAVVGGIMYGLMRPGPVPLVVVPVLLGVIIVAGYAVSYPAEWGRNNYVLWMAYTIYMAGSAGAFWVLRRNQV